MAKLDPHELRATVDLHLHITEVSEFIKQTVFEAMEEVIGFDAVAEARNLCPILPHATKEREPGRLRDSISCTVKQTRSGKGVRARMTTSAGYGGWVELGTANRTAEPYLWPAVELHAPRLTEVIAGNLAMFQPPTKSEE
jgi:hypothetical protein